MSKQPISLVQRGNLRSLEDTLRKQWRLGQNIVLCWCRDERGLLVIFVPHYFLGNFCAEDRTARVSYTHVAGEVVAGDLRPAPTRSSPGDNESYVRDLISGRRRKTREELFAVAARLGVSPTFIKLPHPLEESAPVMGQVEEIIRRYGLSFVRRRAVLLFDIADFSLCSPFEQASQLNSLSYSMNSAYNKLSGRGVYINFARTTTGDGYYVWNRDSHETSDTDLFLFLLLTLADNHLARAASRGNTVPLIRAGFHIGSHYELYQAEGVNPTVFSYIVGDVTIELARMLEQARPRQVMVGDFACRDGRGDGTAAFLGHCAGLVAALDGLQFMDTPLSGFRCWLTESGNGSGAAGDDEPGAASPDGGKAEPFAVTITDKHGIRHRAFNLQASFRLADRDIELGLTPAQVLGS